MLQHFNRTHIALARTYFPENIGSSARAMAVMGFSHLSVIAPYCDPRDERAVTLASHAAESVLKNVKVYSSMTDWASTCDFRVGFCLRNRALGPKTCMLTELPDILKTQPHSNLGLLFGCEKSGLDNHELSFCHYVCEIPTSSLWNYHSLNLAQAVQVVSYTLFTQWRGGNSSKVSLLEPGPSQTGLKSLDGYLSQLVLSPKMRSFSQRTTPEQTLRRLRMMAARSIQSQADCDFFYGFLKGLENG